MAQNQNELRIYYAHSKKVYGTPQEAQEMEFLKKKMPNATIICPNKLGELHPFDEYLKIVDGCNKIIASEVEGFIAKGVFSEIARAFSNNTQVLVLREQANEFYLLMVTGLQIINQNDWKNKYGKLIVEK